MRRREQKGCIVKRNGVWVLRYRITVNESGGLKTVQKARVLAEVDANHKTEASVRKLAKEFLAEINEYRVEPETVVTMGQFTDRVYLPFVKAQKRPSTEKGYRDIWQDHLKSRCESVLLRDVRTCHVQRWLETVAKEDKTKKEQPLSRRTLQNMKNVLSGIFKHAKQQGYFDGVNPVQDTATPKAPKGGETYAYSVEEIESMLRVLPEPARTVVAVAALTGVRRGELRGIRWENYRDGEIRIESSMWKSHVTEPKTRASKAPVAIVPFLARTLEAHRQRQGNPTSGLMFPASNGKPFDPNNVLGRVILPVLNRCSECRKSAEDHGNADHDFKRDASLPAWHGWHAFRRGLATNLYRMGMLDKNIQGVMRHSNLATTQNVYIKSVPEDVKKGMENFGLTFSDCSQQEAEGDKPKLQLVC